MIRNLSKVSSAEERNPLSVSIAAVIISTIGLWCFFLMYLIGSSINLTASVLYPIAILSTLLFLATPILTIIGTVFGLEGLWRELKKDEKAGRKVKVAILATIGNVLALLASLLVMGATMLGFA